MTRGEMAQVGRKILEAVAGAEGYRPWRWQIQTRRWTRWYRAKPGDLRFVWSQYWVRVEVFRRGSLLTDGSRARNQWRLQQRIVYSEFYRERVHGLFG